MAKERRLRITFFVSIAILAGEVIGGYLSHSLALLSDAGHMLIDSLAVGLGLLAERIGRRPPDRRATLGYQRVGLLAALINGVSLLLLSVFLLYEAYQRFLSPAEIDITIMLPIAFLGLSGNLLMAIILGHDHEDVNLRAVWLHILGDTLSSLGVITSGIIIYFTGWVYADPIASLLISLTIMWGSGRLIHDTLFVFLNFTPKGFNIDEIVRKIQELPDVLGVHHVHLLTVSQNDIAFTAHIIIKNTTLNDVERTKYSIEDMLRKNGITHSTLQIETTSENCDANLFYKVNRT